MANEWLLWSSNTAVYPDRFLWLSPREHFHQTYCILALVFTETPLRYKSLIFRYDCWRWWLIVLSAIIWYWCKIFCEYRVSFKEAQCKADKCQSLTHSEHLTVALAKCSVERKHLKQITWFLRTSLQSSKSFLLNAWNFSQDKVCREWDSKSFGSFCLSSLSLLVAGTIPVFVTKAIGLIY